MANSPEPIEQTRALELKLASVVPTAAQQRWHHLHTLYSFIHFGVNGFTDREWGTGTESPAVFNPTALDARQWARSLRAAGMSMAIFTAKHHDGFCLWPSRYTQHSVASSPYQSGTGDVVREFVTAMREEGLAIGLYLSPADLYQIENPAGYYGNGSPYVESAIPTDPPFFHDAPTRARRTPHQAPVLTYQADDYNRYFLNQLYELLTEYGPIDELWLDGATPKSKGGQRYAYQAWYDLIRTLQPNAVIFGKGPDVRWVGNESGVARESEWSVVGLSKPAHENDWPDLCDQDLGSRAALAQAPYLHWYPAEADTSIRPGWFYHAAEDAKVKSADTLMDLYLQSVGRNASFLLNVPPDRRGLFHENDVAVLTQFGQRLRRMYSVNHALRATVTASSTHHADFASNIIDGNNNTYWQAEPWQASVTLELKLAKPATVNRILLREPITRGQRVESFTVSAHIGGAWQQIAAATTIGAHRILSFPEITTDAIRIDFTHYRVAPAIAEIGLYHDAGAHPSA